MALRWEETAAIIRQLDTVFQSEDSDLIATLAHQANDLTTLLQNTEADVRASIRELAKQMYGEDSAEAKRDRLLGGLASATAAHTVAMASLQTVHSETAHEIQQLKQEDAALKQELAAVASADKKTDVQTARLDEARTADIPRVKHSISLYCNISHIRWDTESRNVAGCVMPPDGGVMKPFDIDATKVSEFYVANKLWDLIGDATAVQ